MCFLAFVVQAFEFFVYPNLQFIIETAEVFIPFIFLLQGLISKMFLVILCICFIHYPDHFYFQNARLFVGVLAVECFDYFLVGLSISSGFFSPFCSVAELHITNAKFHSYVVTGDSQNLREDFPFFLGSC